MANAPFGIIQGSSKLGRDIVEVMDRMATEFNRADRMREAMVEQQDKPTGTLSVRSGNSNGQLTLGAGHGVAAGILVDVLWSGGQRLGMLVDSISGNNVVVSGGSGDNLPSQDAAVTCVHFTTVASVFKFHNGDGATLSPLVAYRAYYELASCVGTIRAALMQCSARFKQ